MVDFVSTAFTHPPMTIERIDLRKGFAVKLYRNYKDHEAHLPRPRGSIGTHLGCDGEAYVTFLETPFLRKIYCQECGVGVMISYHLITVRALWDETLRRNEERKRSLLPGDDHHDG